VSTCSGEAKRRAKREATATRDKLAAGQKAAREALPGLGFALEKFRAGDLVLRQK
jgi:hypothetical protein